MFDTALSRRNVVKGAALAGAAAIAGQAVVAHADEAAKAGDGFTYADTVKWDAEYDVVVVGMGDAGLAAAVSAAEEGASVLLLEKAPENLAGGNSKLCGQLVFFGNDDEEATKAYLKAMAGGRELPDDVLEAYGNGVAHSMDVVESLGFDRSLFTDLQTVGVDYYLKLAPEYPEFDGADKMTIFTAHNGTTDRFIWRTLRNRVAGELADKVDVWFESPATKLFQDPQSKTVVGVEVSRNGETRNVRAVNGVCMCSGGFECNAQMVQDYLNVTNYGPFGGMYNNGDGHRMCMEIGADFWHMNCFELPPLQLMSVSYPVADGAKTMGAGALLATGSVILVGPYGRRIGNETEMTRHGHMSDGNGMWENPRMPEQTWVLWDQANMDAIDAAGAFDETYRSDIVECATLADVAAQIGCDEENISKTVDNYNMFAENGEDFEFSRDPETMTAFDGVKYYLFPVKNIVLNTQGGPRRNGNAEVLDYDGNPIPHLYSAGEFGGVTVCMYNGGGNVAECLIFGQIAGKNAAQPKDELPAYENAEAVESTPATVGTETDIVADADKTATVNDDGTVTGIGIGMGGDVPVTVTFAADGSVESVEVGSNGETPGIGSKAVEQMPERFAGVKTADDAYAVDGVSGATLTSQALRDAVAMAIEAHA